MYRSGVSSAGRPPRATDEDILEVFQQSEEPVLTTVEVAAELPIKRHAVYKRLDKLAEEGSIVKKPVGNSGTVWYLAD